MTHQIPEIITKRAAKLGLIVVAEEQTRDIDLGLFNLKCAQRGCDVWVFRLPLAGILDAPICFENELRDGDAAHAWRNFGERWHLIERSIGI